MIFTLMLTTALAATAQRQQVSRQEAESAALTRVRGNNPSRNVSIIDVTSLLNTQGDTILYEIETDQAISVILSGNKACLPILGVHGSMEGSYLQQYDSLPEGLRFLLDCYSEQTPTTLLDLSALPAGTYFVTVTIGVQTGTRKLVVK